MNLCLNIFDSMKKVHGMGARERLLLQIAALLHDCGKYISMGNVSECSYQIIMSTDIIGLSSLERQMLACAVRYNTSALHIMMKSRIWEWLSTGKAISRLRR